MKYAYTLAAAITFVATPALANDNPRMQVYAGPVIGYDNVALSNVGGSVSKGGLSYGGILGVDAPTGGRTRIGVEAEVTGSTTSETLALDAVNSIKMHMGRDLSISAKVGFMVTSKLEAFAKVGYTNTSLSIDSIASGVVPAQPRVSLAAIA